jgi:uncharacterized Zn finger protein
MVQMKKNLQSSLIEWLRQSNPADVKKGFKLYRNDLVNIEEYDEKTNKYYIEVPSESSWDHVYDVTISFTEFALQGECDCPAFENAARCKHVVAAIIEILFDETDYDTDEIEQLVMKEKPTQQANLSAPTLGRVVSLFNEPGTEIPWKNFSCEPQDVFEIAFRISGYLDSGRLVLNKVKMLAANEADASWVFEFKEKAAFIFYPEIKYDRNNKFEYRCTCSERTLMCKHIKAAFDWLDDRFENKYFTRYKNWEEEKEKLLEVYGLTLKDEEAKQIIFTTNYNGKLQMKAPAWLWEKNADKNIAGFKNLLAPKTNTNHFTERPKLLKESIIDFKVGFLFNLTSQHFKIGFELETIKVFEKPAGKTYKKLSLHNSANLSLLKELPDEIYELITTFSDGSIKQYLTDKGHGYVNNYVNAWTILTETGIELLRKHYLVQLQKLWPWLCEQNQVFILKEGTFSNKNIQPVQLSPHPISLAFLLQEDDRFITIKRHLVKNDTIITEGNITAYNAGIIIIADVLHLPPALKNWRY